MLKVLSAKRLRHFFNLQFSTSTKAMSMDLLTSNLSETDPKLYDLIKKEKERQRCGLELIASENFTSSSVLQCLSSCLHNKYSEGLPGQRYYGGNEFIDKVEVLAQERSIEAFNLDKDKWGCNVQVLSGSPANIITYTAIAGLNGRIMGLYLPDGGHLTHGFQTETKKVSVSSLFFESKPYKVDPKTGLIDYDNLAVLAKQFKPHIIIAGISAYSRHLNYEKFRKICDENNCYLMADMSHVSGLVAAGLAPSPFDWADLVTTTTHKTLRGPRAAVIFFRKGVRKIDEDGATILYDLESKINSSVFPGFQGGPHNNAIAAIATAMFQVKTVAFQNYQKQVVENAQYMAKLLMENGFNVVTNGTDNHMLVVDLRKKKVTGTRAEKFFEMVSIVCNKNTIPGDKSSATTSGIRLGTPALTTRGFVKKDIEVVVGFIVEGIELVVEIGENCGPKIVDFMNEIESKQVYKTKIELLRGKVEAFASKFPLPGLDIL